MLTALVIIMTRDTVTADLTTTALHGRATDMLPNHMIGWSLAVRMWAKCMPEGVQADHRTQILVIVRFEWCGTTLALVVVCPEPSREGGQGVPRGRRC